MSKAVNINFSDEKLDLDYLVFNLPRFRTRMLKVAKIFHKYRFNSRTYNADTEKYSTILYEKTFTHWLTFTLENELWNKDNLSIHFKPSNSRRIYFFIKEGIFSISQLNCPNLSINRIDIQYIRPNENTDTNLMDFFIKSLENWLNQSSNLFWLIRRINTKTLIGRGLYFNFLD